jgi:hypothetical protein
MYLKFNLNLNEAVGTWQSYLTVISAYDLYFLRIFPDKENIRIGHGQNSFDIENQISTFVIIV